VGLSHSLTRTRRESSGLRVKGFFVRGFFSFEGVAV